MVGSNSPTRQQPRHKIIYCMLSSHPNAPCRGDGDHLMRNHRQKDGGGGESVVMTGQKQEAKTSVAVMVVVVHQGIHGEVTVR